MVGIRVRTCPDRLCMDAIGLACRPSRLVISMALSKHPAAGQVIVRRADPWPRRKRWFDFLARRVCHDSFRLEQPDHGAAPPGWVASVRFFSVVSGQFTVIAVSGGVAAGLSAAAGDPADPADFIGVIPSRRSSRDGGSEVASNSLMAALRARRASHQALTLPTDSVPSWRQITRTSIRSYATATARSGQL
jgi:hypothetical protein